MPALLFRQARISISGMRVSGERYALVTAQIAGGAHGGSEVALGTCAGGFYTDPMEVHLPPELQAI